METVSNMGVCLLPTYTKRTAKKAVILNFSGHKVPQNLFDKLKEDSYEHFVIGKVVKSFNLRDAIDTQIETFIVEMSEQTDNSGNKLFQISADKFVLLPSLSPITALLAIALTACIGKDFYLVFVAQRSSAEYKVSQIISVRDFGNYWRSCGRLNIGL